jgi:hypothetical protein
MNLIYQEIVHVFVNRYLVYFRMWTNITAIWVMFHYNMGYPELTGINYFADLRMTFRQNFFLKIGGFRNKFGVGLG